jgi:hypothetical protein
MMSCLFTESVNLSRSFKLVYIETGGNKTGLSRFVSLIIRSGLNMVSLCIRLAALFAGITSYNLVFWIGFNSTAVY